MLYSRKEVRHFDGESGEEGIGLYSCNWSHFGGKDGPSVWKLRTALYSLVTHPQNRFHLEDSPIRYLAVKLNPS